MASNPRAPSESHATLPTVPSESRAHGALAPPCEEIHLRPVDRACADAFLRGHRKHRGGQGGGALPRQDLERR